MSTPRSPPRTLTPPAAAVWRLVVAALPQIVPCLVCLDDDLWKHVFPASTVAAVEALVAKPSRRRPCAFGGAIVALVTVAVALLSVPVFTNLVSQHQVRCAHTCIQPTISGSLMYLMLGLLHLSSLLLLLLSSSLSF